MHVHAPFEIIFKRSSPGQGQNPTRSNDEQWVKNHDNVAKFYGVVYGKVITWDLKIAYEVSVEVLLQWCKLQYSRILKYWRNISLM